MRSYEGDSKIQSDAACRKARIAQLRRRHESYLAACSKDNAAKPTVAGFVRFLEKAM